MRDLTAQNAGKSRKKTGQYDAARLRRFTDAGHAGTRPAVDPGSTMAEHATFHEPVELLSQAIMERHRAIVSLMEELEAVDWYDQRVEASSDSALASVMAHNRDEEKEHAAMVLEWLRRHDAVLSKQLSTYLFKDKSILETEAEAETGDAATGTGDGSLGIGSLRQEVGR